MPDQLEILDVRLGTPRPSTFNADQQSVDVAIDVRSHSNQTLHLISSIRALDYDPITHTLSVGLSESELPAHIKLHQFIAPHTVPVAPKETATIQVSVPLVIRKVIPSSRLSLGVEEVDISGVQKVKCEVAYSPTPFYPKPTNPPEKVRRALRSWGSRTETVLPRSLGGSPVPADPPPARKVRKRG